VRRLLAADPANESEITTPSNLDVAGPAAQDRMRAIKARLLECLPSCRTFLDVDGNSIEGKTQDAPQSWNGH
jgi:hypothetical protein